MRFGSLFAGIGGIDLGLERAGIECAWQVEIDDYCTKVLEKHWPDVPRYGDIRELHGHGPSRGEGWYGCDRCLYPVDLIAGGFPCQPHSVAGKRRGAEDDRNLWPEFSRVIRELKPRYVLAENVPGIITTYIDTVLSDLESQGYTCATFNLPAVAFDAPHRRERIFIVAYSAFGKDDKRGLGNLEQAAESRQSGDAPSSSGRKDVAYADRTREPQSQGNERTQRRRVGDGGEAVADTERFGQSRCIKSASGADRRRRIVAQIPTSRSSKSREQNWWTTEPDVGRVAHGIPARVDRLRGLGNAVVPQVAEWIGRRILEFEEEK